VKIFVDANLLVAVLNREYPLYDAAARILSLANQKNHHLYTSPVCLAIAFYFAEKKSGRKSALGKIQKIADYISVTTIDDEITRKSLNNSKVEDFEDGLEYYSAVKSGCECIITENQSDFYFSEIPVYGSSEFLNILSAKK